MKFKPYKHNTPPKHKEKVIREYRAEKARKFYQQVMNVAETIVKKHNISIGTLLRWNKQYDGTIESLANKSKINKKPNPKSPTQEQRAVMMELSKKGVSLLEIYTILKEQYNYQRKYEPLTQYIRRHNLQELKKHEKYVPQEYHTPINIGEKWQMDIKYIDRSCQIDFDPNKPKNTQQLYKYAIIDEASRVVFAFVYESKTSENTIDFVRKAINSFGYIPKIIQRDKDGNMLTPKQKEIELLAEIAYYSRLPKVDFIVSTDGNTSPPPTVNWICKQRVSSPLAALLAS